MWQIGYTLVISCSFPLKGAIKTLCTILDDSVNFLYKKKKNKLIPEEDVFRVVASVVQKKKIAINYNAWCYRLLN